MSSSALASARRRRAGGETSATPPILARNAKVEQPEAPIQNQPLTPLVILQQHELKIKQLEGLITKEEDYEELFQQIDEKIDKLFTVNFEVFNNELNALKSRVESGESTNSELANTNTNTNTNAMKSLIEDNIAFQSSRIEDFKSSQTQLFGLLKDDTTKVLDLLSVNMETKFTLLNSNTSQLESKINELSVNYENQQVSTNVVTKLESELNMVKTTLISNQSMILEMSNAVSNIKDTLKLHKEHITSITSKLEKLGTGQDRRNSAHDLLSSLMSMNTRCVNPNGMSFCCEAEECEAEDCQAEDCMANIESFNFERANLGELNIDFNNDELIMDENQIAELLEIRNFDTINIDDTIGVLDCEIVETDTKVDVPIDAPIDAPINVESDVPTDVPFNVESGVPIDVPINVIS